MGFSMILVKNSKYAGNNCWQSMFPVLQLAVKRSNWSMIYSQIGHQWAF